MNEQGFLALVKKNGHYGSQREANRAAHAVSVFSAVARSLKEGPGRSLGQVFPPEIMGVCRASNSWAA